MCSFVAIVVHANQLVTLLLSSFLVVADAGRALVIPSRRERSPRDARPPAHLAQRWSLQVRTSFSPPLPFRGLLSYRHSEEWDFKRVGRAADTFASALFISTGSILNKALARMDKYGGSPVMKEVVAELYQMQVGRRTFRVQ